MASELALTHPFLRPGTGPLGAEEQRRKAMSKTVSTVLASLLHVLFFFFFVLAVHPFDMKSRPLIETILTLTMPGNNRPPERPQNPEILTDAPPRLLSAPITIPKPPPIHMEEDNKKTGGAPGDILSAVGRALACDAGSWEHLTSTERERCGLYPWRGVKLPNGSLVMIPRGMLPRLRDTPETEFRVNSGSDRVGADIRNGITAGQGDCPILQNTPCVHVSPGMRSATGNN